MCRISYEKSSRLNEAFFRGFYSDPCFFKERIGIGNQYQFRNCNSNASLFSLVILLSFSNKDPEPSEHSRLYEDPGLYEDPRPYEEQGSWDPKRIYDPMRTQNSLKSDSHLPKKTFICFLFASGLELGFTMF